MSDTLSLDPSDQKKISNEIGVIKKKIQVNYLVYFVNQHLSFIFVERGNNHKRKKKSSKNYCGTNERLNFHFAPSTWIL